jgi:hypothetical protein
MSISRPAEGDAGSIITATSGRSFVERALVDAKIILGKTTEQHSGQTPNPPESCEPFTAILAAAR